MLTRSIAAALLASALTLPAGETVAADPPQPVVVELFQSQGCSSCPPANANLNAIADRPDVLALSFGVTYWDELGWKDTFARPQYTARQWDYARSLGNRNVATPQMVVAGTRELVGGDRRAVDAAIRSARPTASLSILLTDDAVDLGAGKAPSRPAAVWLVRYDPRVRQVAIKRGENGGKTLPHRNVVVDLVRLGDWSGRAVRYRLSRPADPALKTAILVQSSPAGAILAAAKG